MALPDQYRPDPTSGSYMADDIAALQYLYGDKCKICCRGQHIRLFVFFI